MRYLFALLLMSVPAFAEGALPALHDVAGVASNDVLNLRAEPSASAQIVGSLTPNQQDVEVVGLSPDGKWGRINLSESSGWASKAFLTRQNNAPWFALQSGLHCSGTEPFWSLTLDPVAKSARFATPESEGLELTISTTWPGNDWQPVAGLQMSAGENSAMAVIRAEACSDGMSDRTHGLAVDVFSFGATTVANGSLHGCCTLVP